MSTTTKQFDPATAAKPRDTLTAADPHGWYACTVKQSGYTCVAFWDGERFSGTSSPDAKGDRYVRNHLDKCTDFVGPLVPASEPRDVEAAKAEFAEWLNAQPRHTSIKERVEKAAELFAGVLPVARDVSGCERAYDAMLARNGYDEGDERAELCGWAADTFCRVPLVAPTEALDEAKQIVNGFKLSLDKNALAATSHENAFKLRDFLDSVRPASEPAVKRKPSAVVQDALERFRNSDGFSCSDATDDVIETLLTLAQAYSDGEQAHAACPECAKLAAYFDEHDPREMRLQEFFDKSPVEAAIGIMERREKDISIMERRDPAPVEVLYGNGKTRLREGVWAEWIKDCKGAYQLRSLLNMEGDDAPFAGRVYTRLCDIPTAPPPLPLSVADAKRLGVCRVCGQPPGEYDTEPDEYAHVRCLPQEQWSAEPARPESPKPRVFLARLAGDSFWWVQWPEGKLSCECFYRPFDDEAAFLAAGWEVVDG